MTLHDAVEFAINHALVLDTFDPRPGVFDFLEGKPDDEPLHINPGKDDCPENIVYVETTDNYQGVFTALHEVRNTTDQGSLNYAAKSVRHEGQHWRAAQLLGAQSGRFGIAFFWNSGPQGGLCYQAQLSIRDMSTTKLGMALILGYPVDPSAQDISDIKSMGYSGLREISLKAAQRNGIPYRETHQSDLFYPVPLSPF